MLFIDSAPDGRTRSLPYEYSTIKAVRDKAQHLLAPPVIKAASKVNADGLAEQWNITLSVKSPVSAFAGGSTRLAELNLMAAFDYATTGNVKLQMESLAIAQVVLPLGSQLAPTKIVTDGVLKLKQSAPIGSGVGSGTRTVYNDALLDKLATRSADSLRLEYATQRNETTLYQFSKQV